MAQITAIDSLISEITDELTIEFSDDSQDVNTDILEIKVKNAVRKVRRVANIPTSYTEDEVAACLANYYYDVIHDIAGSNYSKIGAEGQTEHSEDDVKRVWQSEEELLKGVHAFVTVL